MVKTVSTSTRALRLNRQMKMQIFSDLVGTGVSFASQNGRSASNAEIRTKNDRIPPFPIYRVDEYVSYGRPQVAPTGVV